MLGGVCVGQHCSSLTVTIMAPPLSDQLALRIGLAARTLPGVSAARLVSALIHAVRFPLTDQKLKQVSVGRLRNALGDDHRTIPHRALADAVAFLQDRTGVDVIDTSIPPVMSYSEGDMPGSIRLAVASSRGTQVDGTFSDCLHFLIYQVSRSEVRLIDIRGTAAGKGQKDPLSWRVRLIGDCHMVSLLAANTPATAALMKAGIYLLKTGGGRSAQDCVEDVRTVLADSPPPWLGKLMGKPELERWHFPRPLEVQ